jgi:hypothetical protein
MRKRSWTVEWRARPQPNGNERLGLAIKLLIERAAESQKQRASALTDRRPEAQLRVPDEEADA